MPRFDSQRRGAILFLSIITVILAVRLAMNPMTVHPGQSPGPKADQLSDRIDPNTASPAELAAIPGLGQKRAEAIIAFREKYKSRHPGGLAFNKLEDLEQVPGIGPATAEDAEPYLEFPTAPK